MYKIIIDKWIILLVSFDTYVSFFLFLTSNG